MQAVRRKKKALNIPHRGEINENKLQAIWTHLNNSGSTIVVVTNCSLTGSEAYPNKAIHAQCCILNKNIWVYYS